MNSPSPSVPLTPSQQASHFVQSAETYYAQGKFAEAATASRQAIELDPNWAEAYVSLGNASYAQGQIDEAIRLYTHALKLNPSLAQAYANLGSMLYQQGQLQEAIVHYRKALQLKPDLAPVYLNLSRVLRDLGKPEEAQDWEQKAVSLKLQLSNAQSQLELGREFAQKGQLDQAIACWEQAIKIDPNFAEAYCQLGIVLRHQGQFKRSTTLLQKAIELQPTLISAHQNLCGILRDSSNLETARQAVNQYYQLCHVQDPIMTTLYFLSTYQVSGLNELAKTKFLELERQLLTNFQIVRTVLEVKALYGNFLFSVPYLRDSVSENSQLYRLISQAYIDRVLAPNLTVNVAAKISKNKPLRIGFISNHLNRHSVGWCSFHLIQELGKIAPVYIYITERMNSDDLTEKLEQAVTQFYRPKNYPNGLVSSQELINQIKQDEIDVLIDLDSLSVPVHTEILYAHPAPICLTWLGFDAPYISEQNYFLCDSHTHPPGRENNSVEKLIRMPHCFMTTGGFEQVAKNPVEMRRANRVGLDQVVYLSVAPGRKFNPELAKAQVTILKQVPNSLLVHKGLGDDTIFRQVYAQACQEVGVSPHRVKFLSRFKTEEEHRGIYNLVDILLDSYPYNGGTHTLEALWFNVPVVTRVGEQFLSRMGYSLLKGLGIEAGIAQSWEEYIEWGVKLGQDTQLRNFIRQTLEKSKDPAELSPVWNPKKFAQDLYQILQGINH